MWTNWSGGQQSRPRSTDRPLDEAGVVAAVLRAAERGQRIRPVGSRWSWSPLAVTDEVQLDASALTGVVAVGSDVGRKPRSTAEAPEMAAVLVGVCTAPDRGTGDSVLKEWWGSGRTH
jgi:L-gulonolactone oxidase